MARPQAVRISGAFCCLFWAETLLFLGEVERLAYLVAETLWFFFCIFVWFPLLAWEPDPANNSIATAAKQIRRVRLAFIFKTSYFL